MFRLSFLVSCLFYYFLQGVLAFSSPATRVGRHSHVPLWPIGTATTLSLNSRDAPEDNSVEALHSLVDFHEGIWEGQAKSFTVTADVAAGIMTRKVSPPYRVSVKLGIDLKRDYTLSESITWNDDKISHRIVSLKDSDVDVDAVDGSYSFDCTLPDFPSDISGSDKLPQFMVESCIATGDDTRVRALIFYGVDNQSLSRVVVCSERRVRDEPLRSFIPSTATLTARDLIEVQGDVDQLVDKIASRMNTVNNAGLLQEKSTNMLPGAPGLIPHTTSLVELSSGVWVGDVVVRDMSFSEALRVERRRGFGVTSTPLSSPMLGRWSLGVQKVAWRWMWNFGEEIKQVHDVGKSLGSPMDDALSQSLGGSVCVNEALSRRIPTEDRMVYVDWAGDNIGFLLGSVYVQAPRYLNFDRTRERRPFFTELGIFQKEQLSDAGSGELEFPSLVCSKISRVYSVDGKFKQGCTSFFSLKRFGVNGEGV